jgi:hypothetical protein
MNADELRRLAEQPAKSSLLHGQEKIERRLQQFKDKAREVIQ